jgi:hypothetical protein
MWNELSDPNQLVQGRRVKIYDTEYTIASITHYWITLINDRETWTLDQYLLIEKESYVFE